MAIINGTSGDDVLKGTLQDQINGRSGNDQITGSGGDDTLEGSTGNDFIYGGAGNDIIRGGTGNDWIVDGGGWDTVFAGEGDDTLIASGGNDTYEGGRGFDTIDFSGSANGVTVDLHRGKAFGDETGTDSIKDIEKVIGTAGDDTFRGSMGDDVIVAGDGNNVIRGGQGSDDITLGGDRDTIVFRTSDVVDIATGASRGVDVIHGFNSGSDTLDLSDLFTSLAGTEYRENIDDLVRMTDTSAGTLVQVNLGNGFMDIALLVGSDNYGVSAAAWASDTPLLV